MTLRILPVARSLALACLLLSTAAYPEAPAPVAGNAASAALKRDSARCHAFADVDACYDAIRWNPGNPELLVALADALTHANRPLDALRNYHRAAELAPNLPGVAAKISVAEAKLHARRVPVAVAGAKRYSNAAPVAQSH
jgi:cytochrome c-type biogenesis protein CcmH/NrfG